MKLKWLSNLNKFINHFSVSSVTKIWKKYKRLSLISPINDKLASRQKRKYIPSWAMFNSNNTGQEGSSKPKQQAKSSSIYASSPLKQHCPSKDRNDSALQFFQGHLLLKEKAKKEVKYNTYY